MRKRVVRTGIAIALLGVSASASAQQTPAPPVQACIDASEQAQKLRDERKLMVAREQLLVCARESCPAIVRKDCSEWLTSLETSLPSIVLQARDRSGADVSAVTVSLDGKPVADKIDGRAIFIDPGRHKVRFETNGQAPIEQDLVVSEGEKNRPVTAVFGGGGGDSSLDSGQVAATTPRKSLIVPVIITGAIGVLALGSWGFFGLTGVGDYNDLEAGCGKTKTCAQSDVDPVQTKFVLADISLAVGAVALVTSGILLAVDLSQGHGSARATLTPPLTGRKATGFRVPTFDVKPLPGGGGMAAFGGSF